MSNAQYRFYPVRVDSYFDQGEQSTPDIIIKAGQMSKEVSLILKGSVYIMNKECTYDYGKLEEGSFFGEISILMDIPNNFSYASNDFDPTPL